jgi:hypothetical protein
MDWYYLSDNHERIAVSEAQLVPLAARGILRPATPVWRKGMADWAACGEVKPEIFTEAATGSGDQRPSGALASAVNGTVIGLGRTLAGYNVWMRIAGISSHILAAGLCITTVLTVWYWGRADEAQWKLILEQMHVKGLPQAAVWALAGFQGLSVILAAWCGFLLLCAAGRAKEAAASGNEYVLTAAIRDMGRYILTFTILMIVSVLFWAGMIVWLGRDVEFLEKEKPSEKAVSI